MKTYNVDLGTVPVDASDTDEMLKQKATQHLPLALRRLGRKAGEEAWRAVEDGFRNSVIRLNRSGADRERFISDIAAQFVGKVTPSERKQLVEGIIEQLKKHKAAKNSNSAQRS